MSYRYLTTHSSNPDLVTIFFFIGSSLSQNWWNIVDVRHFKKKYIFLPDGLSIINIYLLHLFSWHYFTLSCSLLFSAWRSWWFTFCAVCKPSFCFIKLLIFLSAVFNSDTADSLASCKSWTWLWRSAEEQCKNKHCIVLYVHQNHF